MTSIATRARRSPLRRIAAILLLAGTPGFLGAQQATVEERLRVTVMTGGLTPRSAVIVAASGGGDTRLGAAPAFGLDVQYRAIGRASIYGSATAAFGTLHHGTSLGTARETSSDATIFAGTVGVVLAAPSDWFDGAFRPLVRVGAGIKRYGFSVSGASSFIAGTGDFGLGFRAGSGSVEVGAEVRFLPSAFDQGRLPTQGIQTREQRQSDLLFGIGVTIRP